MPIVWLAAEATLWSLSGQELFGDRVFQVCDAQFMVAAAVLDNVLFEVAFYELKRRIITILCDI